MHNKKCLEGRINMQDKRGISLIALVASVAITAALLTSVTLSGINTANNAKKIAFGTEINMIQNAVDAYYTKNNATFPVKDAIVISNVNEQFREEVENNKITLYQIDYDKIGINSLKYGRNENGDYDAYVVSRKTGIVYYAMGIKIGDKTYYSLTDDIKNILNYNSGKNTVNSPVILFEASTTEWTNKDVVLNVKIPIKYTINETENSDLVFKTKGLVYNEYLVNKSGNYILNIKYKDNNDNQKNAVYTVSNVDKTSPTIEFGEQVKIENGDIVSYQEITTLKDDLSGIKKVKYDYGECDKSHFQNAGIDVVDNLLYFKKDYDKITVYVEDNAGNSEIQILNLNI